MTDKMLSPGRGSSGDTKKHLNTMHRPRKHPHSRRDESSLTYRGLQGDLPSLYIPFQESSSRPMPRLLPHKETQAPPAPLHSTLDARVTQLAGEGDARHSAHPAFVAAFVPTPALLPSALLSPPPTPPPLFRPPPRPYMTQHSLPVPQLLPHRLRPLLYLPRPPMPRQRQQKGARHPTKTPAVLGGWI